MKRNIALPGLSAAVAMAVAAIASVLVAGSVLLPGVTAFAEEERATTTSGVVADVVEKSNASTADSEPTTVVLGYYNDDPRFQSGSSEEGRKSGFAYDYLQGMASLGGWTYDYMFGTRDEMLKALENGDIDMLAGVKKTDSAARDVLFPTQDMGLENEEVYIAVAPGREDLLADLDDIQQRVTATSPRFVSDLLQQYYSSDERDQTLTAQQQAYLDERQVLQFGYVANNLPISGESEDGQPLGVTEVVIEELRTFLGIKVEARSYPTVEAMLEGLRAGEIDVAFPVYSDLWVSETNNIIQTHEVVTERAVIAYRGAYRDSITDSIGICSDGLQQSVFVEANYPDAHITSYETRQKAFEALERGEVESVIGSSSVLQRFLIDHDEFGDLNRAFLDTTQAFSMAVNRNDGVLAGILNKAVNHLEESSVTSALVQYSSVEGTYSLASFIRHNAVLFIAALSLFFALLLLAFAAYRRKTRAHAVEMERSHAALENALQAANAANSAKTMFLSSMSHDIRTPMNAILGMTAIAKANINDPEKALSSLDKVTVSSKHLLALINDILDMSKIESGEVSLNEEELDLSDLMNELITLNKPQADAKRQEFIARVPNLSHDKVFGDSLRLQQVFTNLISNAIKYTPAGGRIEIIMSEEPSVDPKRMCLKFVVADNGIGMSEEFVPHIFDPFSRETTTSTGGVQGTGLGMAIVRNTIRMMEGDIEVESRLGEGSTFTVTLFLKPCENEQQVIEQIAGKRILVVDNDEAACESICCMLNEMGAVSDCVLSGREALARMQENIQEEHPYYTVFVDWKMPDMDGVATTARIRELVGDDMPLIIISAYDWSDIEEEALAAGANGFVAKPLFKSRLISLFDRLSNGGGAASEGQASLDQLAEDVNLSGKRALLVEDNDMNAEIAFDILGMTGLELERAVNGEEGVNAFRSKEPGYFDCVLMDIQMPIMNGYEAAKAIRAMDREDAKTIPIFAMTADAFNDDKREAIASGMNDHFAKPLEFSAVFATLKKYLVD